MYMYNSHIYIINTITSFKQIIKRIKPSYWNTPIQRSESIADITLPVSCTVNTLSYT